MDYKEEQTQELEVLESIYPDELVINNSKYPNINFDISIPLELIDMDPLADSLSKQHIININFILPETYPEAAPIINLKCEEIDLNENDDDEDEYDNDDKDEPEQEFDDNGNKILSKLENLADQISFKDYLINCQVKIDETIEYDMLLGMQMCFTLISMVKDNCETWFIEKLHELEKQHELEIEKRELEEQAKFNGTKVTPESFINWRKNFRKELRLDERDAERRLSAHNGKLTGKQMFEQGVAGTSDDLDESMENLKL